MIFDIHKTDTILDKKKMIIHILVNIYSIDVPNKYINTITLCGIDDNKFIIGTNTNGTKCKKCEKYILAINNP